MPNWTPSNKIHKSHRFHQASRSSGSNLWPSQTHWRKLIFTPQLRMSTKKSPVLCKSIQTRPRWRTTSTTYFRNLSRKRKRNQILSKMCLILSRWRRVRTMTSCFRGSRCRILLLLRSEDGVKNVRKKFERDMALDVNVLSLTNSNLDIILLLNK